ncbi:hypothetical protein PUN28_000937 [Cardiocondyla obscurior]|uniref:HEPN domain-containing protein n=1 Tax=Cardiocondyla obscurior TaxID=286306 RepID=A0AAW2H2F1_9HYME
MEKISITSQMLRAAVEELQKFQLFVKLQNLRDYIQGHYPVETDITVFEQELQEALKHAVRIGLLIKHGYDQYYIPTLREEANAVKTAFNAFSEIYKKVINFKTWNKNLRINDTKRPYQKQIKYTNPSKNNETNANKDSDYFFLIRGIITTGVRVQRKNYLYHKTLVRHYPHKFLLFLFLRLLHVPSFCVSLPFVFYSHQFLSVRRFLIKVLLWLKVY